jgi:hypothetical protein
MTTGTNSRLTCRTLALALVGALSLAVAIVGNSVWANESRQEAATATGSPGIDITALMTNVGVAKLPRLLGHLHDLPEHDNGVGRRR